MNSRIFNVKTHGHARKDSHTPTYKVWAGMKKRCRTPSMTAYKYYGGRGIKVCERWMHYENFLADMGEKPDGMSLDRTDADGDYTPENCRWASKVEQMNNRRNSRVITAFGKSLTIPQWVKETGLGYMTIYKRLRAGAPPEEALTRAWYSRGHQQPRASR